MHELDDFYLTKEEPLRSCLIALREIILNQDGNISETRKYGMPCFCYHKKQLCYLWKDKNTNEPYILMVEGKHLEHPLLEKGSRSKMKVLHLKSNKDLPLKVIESVLKEGLELYRNGIIKIK